MVIKKEIHNVDRGDVGVAHLVLQALPSSKVLQEGIWLRALLKEENNGTYSAVPPYFYFKTGC